MRPDSSHAGRRRRGGRRHHSRGRQSTPSSSSSSPKAQKQQPTKKPGFFARLISFFTGKPRADKTAPRSTGTRGSDEAKLRIEQPAKEVTPKEPRASRKPELLEVTSAKVYVGNLSFDALESDLFELFSGVGSVQNAEIVSHRETQKSKGFGFVTMSNIDEAKRAVTELHDKEFMGRRLVISGAKTTDVREG